VTETETIMRTKWQDTGAALRWPAALALIAIAILAVSLSWPTRAPAVPTEEPAATATKPGKDRPPVPAAQAHDHFLKLDSIEGESTDVDHQGEIEVHSWSWGVSHSGTPGGGGGGGGGKAEFTDLTFSAATSKASPQLMLACAQGKHLKSAVLTVRKPGDRPQEYLKITLTDVMVTSFQASGSNASELPVEQFTLGYAQIVMEYRQQKPDGSLGEVIRSGWDVKNNRPL
jgi:type VI secretion system secreted protein Hcp